MTRRPIMAGQANGTFGSNWISLPVLIGALDSSSYIYLLSGTTELAFYAAVLLLKLAALAFAAEDLGQARRFLPFAAVALLAIITSSFANDVTLLEALKPVGAIVSIILTLTIVRHDITGYERRSWHRASAFHALTAQEAADIRKEAGRKQTLVIANPGPEPAPMPVAGRAPTILYLGRIHPKKNLEALVRAWSLIGAFPSQARLVIAGWGEPRDVAALQESLRDAPPGIAFVGPQFGPDKARLLSEARFMILPSLSEGLPVAILESWAAGTPVLMSSECNLPIGFEQGAAIDCGMDSASIAAALHRALTIGEGEWLAMARAANRLAQGPFSRAAIARQWQRAYASLIANTAAT